MQTDRGVRVTQNIQRVLTSRLDIRSTLSHKVVLLSSSDAEDVPFALFCLEPIKVGF